MELHACNCRCGPVAAAPASATTGPVQVALREQVNLFAFGGIAPAATEESCEWSSRGVGLASFKPSRVCAPFAVPARTHVTNKNSLLRGHAAPVTSHPLEVLRMKHSLQQVKVCLHRKPGAFDS
jgi:hypothetical protein